MRNIAVIGSGQMGNGIAQVFAQQGFVVQLIDVDNQALDKAVKTIIEKAKNRSPTMSQRA